MIDKIKKFFIAFPENLKKPFQGLKLSKIALLLAIELLFFALVITLDLLTKSFIYQNLKDSGKDFIIIKDILMLTPIENTGASFGMFQNSTMALSIISLITIIFVAIFLVFSIKNRNFFLRGGLVLVLAGGIGNLIDRFMLGYVRDFIYLEIIDFAVFNIADSALTVGVILILIFVIFYYMPEDKGGKKVKRIKKEDKPL